MLVDTSAWIEYLRGTDSPACRAVRDGIQQRRHLVTCDPVTMELLAGGRSEAHVAELRGLLARAQHVHTLPSDWEDAARIYRSARRQGVTIRKLMDFMIAAVALRSGEPILHDDADFDAIARVVPLRVTRG